MLPEAGAFELIFLAAVALIVVGPKDLPVLLRKIGQFIARMRGMAAEFRASFDEMAKQSELDELRREVEALRNARFGEPIAADLNAQLTEFHDTVRAATTTPTGVVPQDAPVDQSVAAPAETPAETPAKTLPDPVAVAPATPTLTDPEVKA